MQVIGKGWNEHIKSNGQGYKMGYLDIGSYAILYSINMIKVAVPSHAKISFFESRATLPQ